MSRRWRGDYRRLRPRVKLCQLHPYLNPEIRIEVAGARDAGKASENR
jgi:hypothetical protein